MPNVFITGAGQGIGRATAELLAERGWGVGAYDLRDFRNESAESGASKTPSAASSIHFGVLDVTDPAQWESAIADFEANVGPLDVLVNNAGILYAGPFIDNGSFEQDSATIDVNVKGVLYGCRAAYPHLRPGAKVVNMCSASAIYGTPDMAAYSASKFAVRGITEALNLEWEASGITVESIWPLYAKTGMLDNVRTTGTDRMGVRLTAEHVATAVADVVERPRGRVAKVHTPVGTQAKVLFASSHFSPAALARFVNAKLTTNRKVRF